MQLARGVSATCRVEFQLFGPKFLEMGIWLRLHHLQQRLADAEARFRREVVRWKTTLPPGNGATAGALKLQRLCLASVHKASDGCVFFRLDPPKNRIKLVGCPFGASKNTPQGVASQND